MELDTADIIARLEILWKKLEDEGNYVRANTISLAIDELKRLAPLASWRSDRSDRQTLASGDKTPCAPSDAEGDFVSIMGTLTNYIQNERVRAYNEGVDGGCIGNLRERLNELALDETSSKLEHTSQTAKDALTRLAAKP